MTSYNFRRNQHHPILKRAILSIAALGLILPLATINFSQSVTAKRVRTHRTYRIRHNVQGHARGKFRKRRTARRRAKRSLNALAPTYLKQEKRQTFKNINQDRKKNGRPALVDSPWLDRIANLRAKQLSRHFGHFTKSGQQIAALDAAKLGYYPNYMQAHFHLAENIVGGYIDTPFYVNQNAKDVYRDHNGYQLANSDNHYFMDDDADSNWGHRKTILNPMCVGVGIGTYYDPSSKAFYLAEDFSNERNPSDSKADSSNNDDFNSIHERALQILNAMRGSRN